jgi:DNA-binding LacI/PurR family transcriptional regulator
MRGEGNHAFGYETTRRWLNLADGKRPTAVIAFNDEMAIGALHAAQARGVQVGTGLAITGFDDAPMAQYITPSLTTVRQPIEQVGAKLMEILLQILEGEKPAQSQVLIQPRLVTRESTVP